MLQHYRPMRKSLLKHPPPHGCNMKTGSNSPHKFVQPCASLLKN